MIVTLLTDFGDLDGFVGAMRGVILSRAPGAQLVDLAHHVPAGDIPKAARVLARSAPYFPPKTVHLVVVDPGVGSARAAVAVEAGGHTFIAPDNNVLSDVLARMGEPAAIHEITPEGVSATHVSTTFHGRDLFAPAAGLIAAGAPLSDLGPRREGLKRVYQAEPQPVEGGLRGQIIEVDHYGNLITNLPAALADARGLTVKIGARVLKGPQPSYSSVKRGEPVLVIGSEGTLEIAVRGGSAARRFGFGVGATVICGCLEESA